MNKLENQISNQIDKHNQNNKLRFDEKQHKYYLDKKELVSVTTKISEYFPFNSNKISRIVAEKQWVSQEEILNHWDTLRNKGSYIHSLAELYCNNESLSFEQINYIKHVKQFLLDHSEFEIMGVEKRILSRKYKIAGTFDLLLNEKKSNRLYLLDWKTSKTEIEKNIIYSNGLPPFNEIPNNKFYKYSLQLAIYMLILKEEYGIEIYDSFMVHLKSDGTYKKIDPIGMLCEAQELLELNN